uniref:Uncharacterized protein LOC117367186 n=1 Tax=Geotrypetes seraphini TaxID=260995 RepID=A0A6P8SA92_GEOSA|nr:uncharacterized protein LOC117367186 [Geotrypetes seraphini]XP_033815446.1 uncharacterized protein LOC117367186 [Geotrypetes seraphini]XP_033815447.1 uncharacterized protein LOC117367186 [Geotrypetes seraphini]XP_033815448.1 uncharacterized protein LOC117367186 [Geotrypetes seraphini]XP_033815449.1 uncharacterized protein LOC117367186 [Geotrypetes seraphini]XP_033815450.1 uncharacterized protein LOC117367186 [Geotrypetes seraphini]
MISHGQALQETDESEEAQSLWEKTIGGSRSKPKIRVDSDLSAHNRAKLAEQLRQPSRTLAKAFTQPKVKRQPSVTLGSASFDISGAVNMIDTIDRPPNANAEGPYAGAKAYSYAENKPMKRIPKAGVYAEAGVGRASAEAGIFDAEAKGPNAGVEAMASLTGAGVMARAELSSASVNAGPFHARLGLGVDTGASVGLDGVEVKILGTGFKIGPVTGISILGSEISCTIS